METIDIKYQKALDYLYSRLPMFSRTGAAAYKPGLETSERLAEFFDNPHKKFKSIHVGGTNGKGSTSHMIASVLQTQGYKVGLYTSPHLVDFRERIRINGEMIPKDKVIKFTEEWKNSGYEGSPSFFELTMIMAFHWFAEEKVDYAVIEVGMGGRLDSTNIITPLLSIITNISYDHNQFLGDTLSQIAYEKAGIIKPGIPVVIGESQDETDEVFIKKAQETKSSLVFADKSSFAYESLPECPLKGDYQKKNIVTVLQALQSLKKIGLKISKEAIREGIKGVIQNTGLAGRWMTLSQKPLVIADTGHNIAGISYNVNQLDRLMKENPDAKLHIVIGFVADKAIDKIMKALPDYAAYYVTNAQIPRALPASELLKKFEEYNLMASSRPSVPEAFESAKKEASESDIIFVGGSTFIVADLLAYLNQ